jgi:hypothetical protein
MKQLLLTLLLVFTASICNAQTEHMKFKGIPMEGTLQTFTAKLKTKGYTPMGIQDGVSLLTGEFAGYKNCTIGAVADKSGMICKVSVIFPTMDKWSELEGCYQNYKSMLTEKYGEPEDCVEKFKNDYVDDDNSKKYELGMDRCTFISRIRGDNGDIQLEITHQNFNCYVLLSYFDAANQDKLRQHIMDDL